VDRQSDVDVSTLDEEAVRRMFCNDEDGDFVSLLIRSKAIDRARALGDSRMASIPTADSSFIALSKKRKKEQQPQSRRVNDAATASGRRQR
jgi:hypothetical protein